MILPVRFMCSSVESSSVNYLWAILILADLTLIFPCSVELSVESVELVNPVIQSRIFSGLNQSKFQATWNFKKKELNIYEHMKQVPQN